MERTFWDTCPDMKTSSTLFAPTLEEHYQILKTYFTDDDFILDVGCGDRSFSRYIPNSVGIDENDNILELDLSKFNTLHFSESIGYVYKRDIEMLIASPHIKKVVIKDFIYTGEEFLDTTYWTYDFRTLYQFVLPLFKKYNYTFEVKPFEYNTDRWSEILKKYNMAIKWRPVEMVVVTANR